MPTPSFDPHNVPSPEAVEARLRELGRDYSYEPKFFAVVEQPKGDAFKLTVGIGDQEDAMPHRRNSAISRERTTYRTVTIPMEELVSITTEEELEAYMTAKAKSYFPSLEEEHLRKHPELRREKEPIFYPEALEMSKELQQFLEETLEVPFSQGWTREEASAASSLIETQVLNPHTDDGELLWPDDNLEDYLHYLEVWLSKQGEHNSH